jgi:hypothetical protein
MRRAVGFWRILFNVLCDTIFFGRVRFKILWGAIFFGSFLGKFFWVVGNFKGSVDISGGLSAE